MRFASAFLFFFLSLSAAARDGAILCTGTWAPDTTEQALIKAYGKANVVRMNVYIAEGDEEPGTVLFPNDEKRRVEIVWKDKRRFRHPEWLRIPSGSRWETFANVRIGMTLADLEKANGKPFSFSGFGWDYGGSITNWRDGRFANLGSSCSVHPRLDQQMPERPTKAQEKAMEATSGDGVEVLSSSKNARAIPVVVSEIVVQYP